MERIAATDPFRRYFLGAMSGVILAAVAALVDLVIEKTAAQWPQLILSAVGFGVLFGIGFMVFRLFDSMDKLFGSMEDLTSIAPRLTYYFPYKENWARPFFMRRRKRSSPKQSTKYCF